MRRRLRWCGRWGGLAATVLLVAAIALSARGWGGRLGTPWGALTLHPGTLGVCVYPSGNRPGLFDRVPRFDLHSGFVPVDRRGYQPSPWWPQWRDLGVLGTLVTIPLWPLCAASAGATAVLWRSARRRSRVGYCPRCGYSLAGLSAGAPCPECGRATGSEPR